MGIGSHRPETEVQRLRLNVWMAQRKQTFAPKPKTWATGHLNWGQSIVFLNCIYPLLSNRYANTLVFPSGSP
jgi:hypothetical protein